jgi:Fe-S-cluster containining protein
MDLPEQAQDEASICIGCGFCCDGTLHGHADIDPDDQPAVLAAGMAIIRDGEKLMFRQPCPNFSCGRCSVYAKRPAVCRGYRCKLRKGVDEGRIGVAEARGKIEIVKRLMVRIRSFGADVDTPAQRLTLWRQLKDGLNELEGEARAKQAKAILDFSALDYHLDRWFRRTKSSERKAGP